MTVVQPTQTPTSEAFAALLKADDAMPEAWHSIALFDRTDVVVVLLDSTEAWAAWVVALQRQLEGDFAAQVGQHITTAEGCLCGCPVLLVSGDYIPQEVAA